MKSQLNIVMLLLVSFFYACKEDNQGVENLTYEISQEVIDGISYKCITVGDQVWMAENLKTRLDGGRAEGSMTFEEPFITFESKESLELRQIVQSLLLKQWDDGFFNINSSINEEAKLMIDNDLIPSFFTNTRQTWDSYVYNNDWAYGWEWDYSRTVINLVRDETTRLFGEGKKLQLLAAADQKYMAEHGNLYTFEACQKVVPEGWRIPSDEDWMKLERAMGMSENDVQKVESWRGDVGRLLKANGLADNFNATLGGGYIYGFSQHGSNFVNKGIRGYWWTSTKDESSTDVETYFIRGLRVDNGQMLRGTTPIDDPHKEVYPPAYSIRLVKNK